jgi:serine/threonine protein kinase
MPSWSCSKANHWIDRSPANQYPGAARSKSASACHWACRSPREGHRPPVLMPANVFITRNGRIKVLDFGLARSAEPGNGSVTRTAALDTLPGTVIGTVGYMAPEQVKGLVADERGVIFAFGCILYELLTSTRAFKGQTAAEASAAILRDEPRDLTDPVAGSGRHRAHRAAVPRETPGRALPVRTRSGLRAQGPCESQQRKYRDRRRAAGQAVAADHACRGGCRCRHRHHGAGDLAARLAIHALRSPRIRSLAVLPLLNRSGGPNRTTSPMASPSS